MFLISSRYDQAFRSIVTAGWANESDGNVEAPTGHFARVSIAPNELAELRDACELTDSFNVTGHYLVIENSLGQAYVYGLASEADLIREFRLMQRNYAAWDQSFNVSDDFAEFE